MKTKVWKITGQPAADKKIIQQAAAIIKRGGIVAFPTETVYGLGANALNPTAVSKIFAAKKRPLWDPVIVHIAKLSDAGKLAAGLPKVFEKLAKRFMPGPLTILVEKSKLVPDIVTAGSRRVSIRMPSHPIALKLIKAAGVPIAAPSANLFGKTSPTSAQHALFDLKGRIDAIIDAGPASIGVESTVLDLTGKKPAILRPGGATAEQLGKVLGQKPALFKAKPSKKNSALLSPGTSARHYAPDTPIILAEGQRNLIEICEKLGRKRKRIGIMLPLGWKTGNFNAEVFDWGKWGDWDTLAARLYEGIRMLDVKNLEKIVCPLPPKKGLGAALFDRLQKAAG